MLEGVYGAYMRRLMDGCVVEHMEEHAGRILGKSMGDMFIEK